MNKNTRIIAIGGEFYENWERVEVEMRVEWDGVKVVSRMNLIM